MLVIQALSIGWDFGFCSLDDDGNIWVTRGAGRTGWYFFIRPPATPQLRLPKKDSSRSMSIIEVEGEAMEAVLLTNPGVCSCISCWVSLGWAFLCPLGVNPHWKSVLPHESQLVCSHGIRYRKSWALPVPLVCKKHLLLNRLFFGFFLISEKVVLPSTTVIFWNRNLHRTNIVCLQLYEVCFYSFFPEYSRGEKRINKQLQWH